MNKIFVSFSILLAGTFISAAQEASPTAAMAFSAIPSDPAAMAMGGNTALASSPAWSAHANASVLPFSGKSFAVSAVYQKWQPASVIGTDNLGVGASCLIKDKLGVSASFVMDKSKPYSIINAGGSRIGEFTPSEMTASLGVCYAVADFLSAGAAAHYMSSSLAADAAVSSIALDVLATAEFSSLRAVLGVKSLGARVDGFSIPTHILAALGYHPLFAEKHALKLDAQLNYYTVGAVNVALGAEFCFADIVSARAGYCVSADGLLPSFASVGLGVRFAGVELNAAYLLASEAHAGTMTIGLGYSF